MTSTLLLFKYRSISSEALKFSQSIRGRIRSLSMTVRYGRMTVSTPMDSTLSTNGPRLLNIMTVRTFMRSNPDRRVKIADPPPPISTYKLIISTVILLSNITCAAFITLCVVRPGRSGEGDTLENESENHDTLSDQEQARFCKPCERSIPKKGLHKRGVRRCGDDTRPNIELSPHHTIEEEGAPPVIKLLTKEPGQTKRMIVIDDQVGY